VPNPEKWNRKRSALTAPYYVYRVVFYSRDIPEKVRGLPLFPRTAREIWVWQRQVRDILLALDPHAQWEKHEARKCPRCGCWYLGIQAQMMREREEVARLVPCGESCIPPSALMRKLKEIINAR
jgi:hypothetical protein